MLLSRAVFDPAIQRFESFRARAEGQTSNSLLEILKSWNNYLEGGYPQVPLP